MAPRRGMKIALKEGFHKLIIETGCLKLFNTLKGRKCENNNFGSIVRGMAGGDTSKCNGYC
ncbi:Glycerol kinase [Bienertia sinuspersici]